MYIRRPSWDFSKKLFSYFVENLLTPASIKRNSPAHDIRNFPDFKNMQGKAGGCNLKTCNLL